MNTETAWLRKSGHKEALEASVIGSFFRFADIQGLSLPEVGTDVRQAMQLPSTASSLFYREILLGRLWPPDSLLPVVGLAKRCGLPTRLLDWSRDALTAAYFAANGALRRVKRGERIHAREDRLAVWMFNMELLDHVQRLDSGTRKNRQTFP